MTLEEAIKNREDCLKYLEGIGRKASPECMEAVRWSVKALKALRPVSREQVERVWPGCNRCKDPDTAIAWERWGHQYCSQCGRPLSPEAWEELRKRLEALNNGKGE